MKVSKEITILADPVTVWRFFDDPGNTRSWQPALKSQIHVSGAPGEVGAVYELVHDNNGTDLRSVATVVEKSEFASITTSIDSESSFATMTFRFEPMGRRCTRWILETDYRFKGLYRLVAFFLRSSLHARAHDEMKKVKRLLEKDSRS